MKKEKRFFLLIILLFILLGVTQSAQAITVTSVYLNQCQREVGVVVHVDALSLTLINLEGKIKKVNRWDIIYLATYPLAYNPIKKVEANRSTPFYSIFTFHQGEIRLLTKGWLLDHYEDVFAFLTPEGKEVVIDKDDIWDIVEEVQEDDVSFTDDGSVNPVFVHPYPFSHCKEDLSDSAQKVYPQNLIGEPMQMKRSMDFYQKGFEQFKEYKKSKIFYGVPQVYSNENILGMWAILGARHGASATRSSSLVPTLRSELSEGPFGFQRLLVTGSAPMPYSVHEEPQVQLYYRLKSDYVHFSFMYDINRLILGEASYYWSEDDMQERDDHWSETFHLAVGFDIGNWSIGVGIPEVEYAVNAGDYFFRDRAQLFKTSIRYKNPSMDLNLFYIVGFDSKEIKGKGTEIRDDDSPEEIAEKERLLAELEAKPDFFTDMRVYRLNLKLGHKSVAPEFSLIHRKMDFVIENDKDSGEGGFFYRSSSITISGYYPYQLDDDILLRLFLSVEQLSNLSGDDQETIRERFYYPKAGASVNLMF